MPIATVNPASGETVQEFDALSPDQLELRMARTQAASATLRDTTFGQRAGWIRSAADLLAADKDLVAGLLTLEMGKPIGQSRGEVLKCIRGLHFYADNAEQMLADQPLADPSSVGASAAYTRYEPVGAVLAVMPWNYPMWQVIRFAAPALMAGNVGLLKHASNVPQTAIYLDDLFERAGFPVGSFQTLLIGSADVETVIRDRRVAAVTLTGSEPAGRSVASIAGSVIKKAVLELGGADPFIVMPSADVPAAAQAAVIGRTQNNGQSCIAAKRFIVHADVYDEFVGIFVDRTKRLVIGDPRDEATEIGPIATASGRQDLVELVEDAVAHGAFCGAEAHPLRATGGTSSPLSSSRSPPRCGCTQRKPLVQWR